MIFTDDDLKLYQKMLGENMYHGHVPQEKLVALIARLEAAEAFGMKMAKKHPSWFLKELYAWRKVAGK